MMKSKIRIMTATLAVAFLGTAGMASAETIVKASNTDSLNQTTAWVGGVVPGSGDVAQWDSTVTNANTVLLGADASWGGIRFLTPGGGAVISAGNTLTLGSLGVDMTSAGQTLTLNCAVALGADQTWAATSKQFSPYGPLDMGGHQLTLAPASKIQFKNTISGGGTIVVVSGGNEVQFSNGGTGGTTATNTALSIETGGRLVFDTASGLAFNNWPRALSARLNGGTLEVRGYGNNNSTDTVSSAISANTRLSTVKITPDVKRFAQLRAGSLVRAPGA